MSVILWKVPASIATKPRCHTRPRFDWRRCPRGYCRLVSVLVVIDNGVVAVVCGAGATDKTGIIAATGTGLDAGVAELFGVGFFGTIEIRPHVVRKGRIRSTILSNTGFPGG